VTCIRESSGSNLEVSFGCVCVRASTGICADVVFFRTLPVSFPSSFPDSRLKIEYASRKSLFWTAGVDSRYEMRM
jgi:hypothetical protein